jgi:hypothetical protein
MINPDMHSSLNLPAPLSNMVLMAVCVGGLIAAGIVIAGRLAYQRKVERSTLRGHGFPPALVFHTLALVAFLTLLGGAASLTVQQMLRHGANQPQIDMADFYAGEIVAGREPASAISPAGVDLERSLQPFVIFYDDAGKPGPGTGYLERALPVPPAGVFDFVRSQGSERVTWQPRPGVRLATVITRVSGKTPGFVLAGRSLRLVEDQEAFLWWMAFGVWVAVIVLVMVGAFLLNRHQHMQLASS